MNWRSGQGEVTFDPAETNALDILNCPILRHGYESALAPQSAAETAESEKPVL